MGDQIDSTNGEADLQAFTAALLEDLQALEAMIDHGRIETGVRRIGAEQEMFLVDDSMRVAPIADALLAGVDDERLTHELARFNLEGNLSPQLLAGHGLRNIEEELRELVALAEAAAARHGARVLLTGILPTLEKRDLCYENMSQTPRYLELDRVTRRMRGGDFHVVLKGPDELETTHDNVMLEACNTSFQLHLQVSPQEFAPLHNIAQVVTAPVLAAAVNSPVLLQHRLWSETRIALFQHSLDVRSSNRHARKERPRVHFGDAWLNDSILEIFREDIARHRIVLVRGQDEHPLVALEEGRTPKLRALCLHNGTVWRWNRPCYGVADGVAHLRIENRVLPAGPTISDEMANAAFYYGLMMAMHTSGTRVDRVMDFDDAKHNFLKAARQGLDAHITWLDGKTWNARSLVLDELLPVARDGLDSAGVDAADAARYLDILRERVDGGRTGASWALESLREMDPGAKTDAKYRSLADAMLARQREDLPVGRWPLATVGTSRRHRRDAVRTVGQIMATDLFTLRPDDIIDLAASMMDWRHIRHVPVEDDEGRLVGIVSHRDLMKLMARPATPGAAGPVRVSEIMHRDPVAVTAETPTLHALELMQEHGVACLPVLEGERLTGILTEYDLMAATRWLLVEFLGEDDD